MIESVILSDDRVATGPGGDAVDRWTARAPGVRATSDGERTVTNGKLLRQLIRSGAGGAVEVRPCYGSRIRGAIRYTEIGHVVE